MTKHYDRKAAFTIARQKSAVSVSRVQLKEHNIANSKMELQRKDNVAASFKSGAVVALAHLGIMGSG